jgi:hypothetical protein
MTEREAKSVRIAVVGLSLSLPFIDAYSMVLRLQRQANMNEMRQTFEDVRSGNPVSTRDFSPLGQNYVCMLKS